jgi:hypothetical protein
MRVKIKEENAMVRQRTNGRRVEETEGRKRDEDRVKTGM